MLLGQRWVLSFWKTSWSCLVQLNNFQDLSCIAIFLVYKHWRHISFDIQICQPRKKRSHCFASESGSGWHINNNGWLHEKHRRYTCPVLESTSLRNLVVPRGKCSLYRQLYQQTQCFMVYFLALAYCQDQFTLDLTLQILSFLVKLFRSPFFGHDTNLPCTITEPTLLPEFETRLFLQQQWVSVSSILKKN